MIPLAERMRPRSINEYVGQVSIAGPKGTLRKAIEEGHLHSMILWGPPGVGKTTLAHIIASTHNRPFYQLSAINAGVKEVRETIKKAKQQRFLNNPNPIFFIDEIHRFSKSQQDSLLQAVEQGTVTLIGATTENPSFEVISALLSRCQVYVLHTLSDDEIIELVNRALVNDAFLKARKIMIKEKESLIKYAGGDARKAYNIIDILANDLSPEESLVVTNELIDSKLQDNIIRYDKGGDAHYDQISAFIKSIRGSDPNASVYWLASMLKGGEDIKFIARRMIISASEDIGLANPNALLLANATFDAVAKIGMPEARIVLSQCAIYLASSPKSNSAYKAINLAFAEVDKSGSQPVPLHLRNAPTSLMKSLDYGREYKYTHEYEENFVQENYLPETLKGTSFYKASVNKQEKSIMERLSRLWKDHYNFK